MLSHNQPVTQLCFFFGGGVGGFNHRFNDKCLLVVNSSGFYYHQSKQQNNVWSCSVDMKRMPLCLTLSLFSALCVYAGVSQVGRRSAYPACVTLPLQQRLHQCHTSFLFLSLSLTQVQQNSSGMDSKVCHVIPEEHQPICSIAEKKLFFLPLNELTVPRVFRPYQFCLVILTPFNLHSHAVKRPRQCKDHPLYVPKRLVSKKHVLTTSSPIF